MPTYGFRCPEGHEFDRFYKTISAAPPDLPCPECGAVASRQLSGGAGLVFKGSGFYLTDYGKNAHRAEKPGTSKDGKSESGKAEAGKSESAPAKAESREPKAESRKSESAAPKAEAPKANSSKPKAE
jgi:putative FmdB family regulatory protein